MIAAGKPLPQALQGRFIKKQVVERFVIPTERNPPPFWQRGWGDFEPQAANTIFVPDMFSRKFSGISRSMCMEALRPVQWVGIM